MQFITVISVPSFLSDIIIHKISFTVENLSYNFREGHTAVDNISFSIEEGKLIGILGASGSGKTTLAEPDERNSETNTGIC